MNAITDVAGILVGQHHRLDPDAAMGSGWASGVTVVLTPPGTVGAVDVRGGAPGTRETDLLDPANSVRYVDAVLLAGGSAFGLAAADGVMRWLEEHERGVAMDGGVVPIVPAAVIFDLEVGGWGNRPTAEFGYDACRSGRNRGCRRHGRRGGGRVLGSTQGWRRHRVDDAAVGGDRRCAGGGQLRGQCGRSGHRPAVAELPGRRVRSDAAARRATRRAGRPGIAAELAEHHDRGGRDRRRVEHRRPAGKLRALLTTGLPAAFDRRTPRSTATRCLPWPPAPSRWRRRPMCRPRSRPETPSGHRRGQRGGRLPGPRGARRGDRRRPGGRHPDLSWTVAGSIPA